MEIHTTRFGSVEIDPGETIHFPAGMLGLDGCSHWVLLADSQTDALGWLQSTTRADMALAVVSPRRYLADYQVRVSRSELGALATDALNDVHVLAIVSKNENSITLNLKAPIIINLRRRLGRQVVNNADHSLQHELCRETPARKRIA